MEYHGHTYKLIASERMPYYSCLLFTKEGARTFFLGISNTSMNEAVIRSRDDYGKYNLELFFEMEFVLHEAERILQHGLP